MSETDLESPVDNITDLVEQLEISPEDEFNPEPEGIRKIFIGGLSWETTEDGLQHYFESMGMGVTKVMIMRDKRTGRSRGFGFLTLSKSEMVTKAVNTRLHLDGRRIEAKRAIPKRDIESNSRKVFVGGIPIHLSDKEIREYFETFGEVIEVQVMTERSTGRSRGFAFVTFADEDVSTSVIKGRHVVSGKAVEVKRAQPKLKPNPQVHYIHPVPVYGMPHPYYGMQSPPKSPVVPQVYTHPGYLPQGYDPYSGMAFAPQFIPYELPYEMMHQFYPGMLGRNSVNSRNSVSSRTGSRTNSYSRVSDPAPLTGIYFQSQRNKPKRATVSSVRIHTKKTRASRVSDSSAFSSLAPSQTQTIARPSRRRGISQPARPNNKIASTSQGTHLDTDWRPTIQNIGGVQKYFQ